MAASDASVAFVADSIGAVDLAGASRLDQEGGTTRPAAREVPPSALPPAKVRGREPLMTIGEVAEHLSVSVRTVRRLVASGQIPCVHVGSQLRFDSADVLRFVAARKE